MENDKKNQSLELSIRESLRKAKEEKDHIRDLKAAEEANREYEKRNVFQFGVGALDGEAKGEATANQVQIFTDGKRLQNVYFLFEEIWQDEPWEKHDMLDMFYEPIYGPVLLKENFRAVKVSGDKCSAPRMESLGYLKGYEITVTVSLPLPDDPEKYLRRIFHGGRYKPIGFVGTFEGNMFTSAITFFQITHYRIKYDILRRDQSGTLVRFRLAPCHWPETLHADCDRIFNRASVGEAQFIFDHNM